MEKIKYTQEIIDNCEKIYKKYDIELDKLIEETENYGDLYLDAMGVPFQDENGDNLSYSSNFLFTYMIMKKLKERKLDISEYVESNPLYYILGYKSKGALIAYILYYREEMGIENDREFIANINNKHYIRNLNEEIKHIIEKTEGFNSKTTQKGTTIQEILNVISKGEELYLLMINTIISFDISIVNQEEEYKELFQELNYFFTTLFNYSIMKDTNFYQLYIKYLSESTESLPLIYELKRDLPSLWEETTELEIKEENN